jgi:Probable zinc-ribbon domain
MPDRTLTCRDCQQEFTFSEGEQQFYSQRGFSEPVRCPDCRRKRKMDRDQEGGGYGGGGYGGGGGGRRGSRY